MKRIRIFMASLAIFLGVGAPVIPAVALADTPKSVVCSTLGSDANCSSNPGGTSLNSVIKAVVNVLSLIVGVVAVIMVIVGGFRFITSGGDSSKAASARGTIMYAIIGLVIVALAQFIVQFVVGRVK